MVSASALGAYTFAFILTDTIKNRIASVISTVMYPVYANLQSDKESSKVLYIKVVEYNCILIYPIMLSFLIFAQPIILNFFGEKWISSVFPTQLLASAVMLQLTVFGNTTLIRGLGFANFEFRLQFVKAMIYMPILFIGVYLNGIIGAAWAVLINRIIAIIITIVTFRIFGFNYTFRDFYSSIRTCFKASLASGILAYVLFNKLGLHYLISFVFMLSAYAILIYLDKKSEIELLIRSLRQETQD